MGSITRKDGVVTMEIEPEKLIPCDPPEDENLRRAVLEVTRAVNNWAWLTLGRVARNMMNPEPAISRVGIENGMFVVKIYDQLPEAEEETDAVPVG